VVLINPFVQDGGGSRQLTNLLLGTLFAGPWGPAAWIRYIASLYPTARPDDFQNHMRRLGASLREPGRFTALRRMLFASKAASAIIHTVLAPYGLPATQEIHAIRAYRSLAHGFVSLELAGGFGLPIDLDESYRTLMDLLVNGLERPPAP
jgi:hypothetical protein